MKFVHLATSLLLLNTGALFAQSGYNGPSPLASPSPASPSTSEIFQSELESDNVNRIQSLEQVVYFTELTACLLADHRDESEWFDTEDSRLVEKKGVLERQLLLSLDEENIEDPEAGEEGIEPLTSAIQSQRVGQIVLLSEQLSTVTTEMESSTTAADPMEELLLEDFADNQEPVQWLVQVELGQIR